MRSALAPLVLALLSVLPWGPASARGVVRVATRATVEKAGLRLGDLALFEGVPRALEERLRQLDLGAAAAPSATRELSGPAVEARIFTVAPEVRAEVPARIWIESASREISRSYVRARLEQALRHVMPWPAGAARFSGWRLPESFAAPPAAHRLRIHFRSNEDFVGRVTVSLEVLDPSGADPRRVRRTASVEVDVRVPVVVTARKLRRRTELAPGDLRVESRDLRGLPHGFATELQQLAGRRLRAPLPEGVPVLRSHLAEERIVRRGDLLVVHAERGGLELRVEAKALQGGILGQSIQVENPQTRRRFVASITGPGQARLGLDGAIAPVGAGR
ncbi:MAG: flagellar basal body P-ring formation chaperone FlgA [Myxococcota bacterium]